MKTTDQIADADDIAQLRLVLSECVENGNVWAALPQPVQAAAMTQFQRLEAAASEATI